LATVLRAVARVLSPGGLFVFTLEIHSGAGARLGKNLRFAHSPAGVVAEAAALGLVTRAAIEGSVRRETGEDVAGMAGVLERE